MSEEGKDLSCSNMPFDSCSMVMHRVKCRSRWNVLRHSLVFVSLRRASDSLLPILLRTRQDSIQSTGPWETQIDYWIVHLDHRREPITRSMPSDDWKEKIHGYERLVQHLKNYDQFLLEHPRRNERTFSEFIFNDLSYSLTRLPSSTTDPSQMERKARELVKSDRQMVVQLNKSVKMESKEKVLMQELFEGKKSSYEPEQNQMEAQRIRK